MVYIKYLLEDIPKENYEIFFVHQNDKRPFNRGAMKNIGFLAIKKKYPENYKNFTFVFNDIDTLPCRKNLLQYETKHGTIKHFYGFKFALGGIFSITGADFEKCNGFPNFWGWGLEDNALNRRAIENNILIDRSNFYTIGTFEILQVLDKPMRLINDRESSIIKSDEGLNDINELEFTFENEYIQVYNFKTRYPFNVKEFYTRDISEPGAHKTATNVLNKWKPINTPINIPRNDPKLWKMF
tara:strand:- start:737 stop:1459 length:723 start_codon:yes stop_codon:yes gene_type:complete